MRAFRDLPERIRLLLGVTVALPLAVALIAATLTYGSEFRQAAEARALALADSLLSNATLADAGALLAGADAGRYDAAAYRRSGETFERLAALPERFGDPALERRVAVRLLADDRGLAIRPQGGRTAVVAPVRDSLQWEVTGALLLVHRAPVPPALRELPLLVGLLVLGLTLLAAAGYARMPSLPRAALVFLPPLAFGAVLIGVFPTAPGGGGYRVRTMAYLGLWAVIAAIGLSLVRRGARPLDLRRGVTGWSFLAPSLLHLLLFSVGPILFSLWLSFHEWNLVEPARPFVGLDNYVVLAGDAEFWRAVRNTALYVLFVPIGMIMALGLALLLNRGLPGQRVLRAVFFLPYITSFVAISLVWRWMFEPDVGILNGLLGALGIPPQPWLASPATALPSLMLMSVWQYAGYMMILFLAGLQSIPASLYESARMDGASAWQQFRRITLPLLRPTTLFVLVTMVIFMFQVFTAVYVMTEGGPLHATDVIVYHIYRNAWEYLRLGYASAMAWVLFSIVFTLTLVQFRWLGREYR